MSTGLAIAITSAALSVLVAMFVVWLTAPWLRFSIPRLEEELAECRRQRDALRDRVALLEHAVMQMLSPEARKVLHAGLALLGREAA